MLRITCLLLALRLGRLRGLGSPCPALLQLHGIDSLFLLELEVQYAKFKLCRSSRAWHGIKSLGKPRTRDTLICCWWWIAGYWVLACNYPQVGPGKDGERGGPSKAPRAAGKLEGIPFVSFHGCGVAGWLGVYMTGWPGAVLHSPLCKLTL